MILVHHTHEQWADIVYNRLVLLGCTEQYAEKERQRILKEAESESPRPGSQ